MAIEIATPLDLYNLRDDLTADYIQVADIDLSGYANWEPIGKSSPFKGSYDGNGYTIENLKITNVTTSYAGLFGILYDANISSINIINANITCSAINAGILSGIIPGAIVEDCYIEGSMQITGDGSCGGLAASIEGSSTVSRCFINANLQGKHIGGLAAYIDCNINDCCIRGKLNGLEEDYSYMGGLAYQIYSSGGIVNCYTEVDFSYNKSIHHYGVRGLFVDNWGNIENCYFDYDSFSIGIPEWEENRWYYGDELITGTNSQIYLCIQDNKYEFNPESRPIIGENWQDYWELYYPDEARTTNQMTDTANYINWDFETIWGISDAYNDGYPVLRVFGYTFTTEDPYLINFIKTPQVNRRAPQANAVTVESPTAEYTATASGLSEDKKIERLVEIDEGDISVCQEVAEELLSRWSRELKSVSGLILLNQDLVFRKKAMININEAMIEDEDMVIQKLEHDIIAQTTLVICGDIILDDAELLARILENL